MRKELNTPAKSNDTNIVPLQNTFTVLHGIKVPRFRPPREVQREINKRDYKRLVEWQRQERGY